MNNSFLPFMIAAILAIFLGIYMAVIETYGFTSNTSNIEIIE